MIEHLAQLAARRQTELDGAIATWRQGPGAAVRLWCGPGCGNCCALTVNCTFPEALAIARALDEAGRDRLDASAARIISHAARCADARSFLAGYREAVGPCPFLDDGSNCTIYPLRPMACRALLATRPPDWCGVNLAALTDLERDAFLAGLDRNTVAFPTHYAAAPQQAAADFERGLILAMIRFAGFGLTGSLPVLARLAGEPDCAAALTGGSEAFRAFAASHNVSHPFLVQLHLP